MQRTSFFKKLITCALAGLVIGASALRMGVTFFRTWVPIGMITIIPFLLIVAAFIYVFIWQARKTNNPATLAFWQGLIRYGVAFDLAAFGWEKICHLQLVMPLSKLDLPYSSFSSSDLFWTFFSYSYRFGCIIAGLQIVGAMLFLFHRTMLVGVFVLLPVLTNILLMDIFYHIGNSVVVHASTMMAGILYFLVMEFNRLKAFFFVGSTQYPATKLSKYAKLAIRLSIIYIPLLLIAMHGQPDRNPQLTGKYDVMWLKMNQQPLYKSNSGDSILTRVYFDINNGCVFEFNTPAKRWSGIYAKEDDHLNISWKSPAGKPVFSGIMSADNIPGKVMLTGMLGNDSMTVKLRKVYN